MKINPLLKFTILSALASLALSTATRADDPPPLETFIAGDIADGTVTPAPPPPEVPDFEVKSELLVRTLVDEPPLFPGIPGVQGIADAVVQLVEDPGEINSAPQPPEPTAVEEEPSSGPVETAAESRLLYLSASVYNHSLTLLTCETGDPQVPAVSAWSNLDFNHFTGFTSCQVKGADGESLHYDLIIALDNSAATPPGLPQNFPPSPGTGPAFVVTEGGDKGSEALRAVSDLHELYKTEGSRMAAAYQGRHSAEETQKAALLADPPAPQGATLRFWSRTAPAESQNGGGQ